MTHAWEDRDVQFDPRTAFLPVSRMRELAPAAREEYRTAQPFPHLVLDGLFDPDLLRAIIDEFPKPGDIEWIAYKSVREIKLASNRDEHFGPLTRILLYHLNSAPFLSFLSEVAGIEGLVADSYFDGGGMHQIQRGGKLAIHADFNRHPMTGLDRRLNALLYLNPDWREEYGGHLELWDSDMTGCVRKVLPVFNRMIVFGTTDCTYHGHPDPLACPEGMTRKSLALYYFSKGRPAEEVTNGHTTLFRERPGETFDSGRPTLRAIAKDLLPPVVTRFISRRLGG
jgi:2OG-Fe(II) oxygenase superfamily